ncbi:MAG: hypothetical protein ACI8W8_000578 [Rhodothermales bacterium]|jgi:hypothetical protein
MDQETTTLDWVRVFSLLVILPGQFVLVGAFVYFIFLEPSAVGIVGCFVATIPFVAIPAIALITLSKREMNRPLAEFADQTPLYEESVPRPSCRIPVYSDCLIVRAAEPTIYPFSDIREVEIRKTGFMCRDVILTLNGEEVTIPTCRADELFSVLQAQ